VLTKKLLAVKKHYVFGPSDQLYIVYFLTYSSIWCRLYKKLRHPRPFRKI